MLLLVMLLLVMLLLVMLLLVMLLLVMLLLLLLLRARRSLSLGVVHTRLRCHNTLRTCARFRKIDDTLVNPIPPRAAMAGEINRRLLRTIRLTSYLRRGDCIGAPAAAGAAGASPAVSVQPLAKFSAVRPLGS
jgi:hypothetical protein